MTTSPRSVLLVGECNPYGSRPELSLYHLPRRASGDRLREHLGLRDVTYHGLAKLNLCTGRWDAEAARRRAVLLLAGGQHDVFVLLGAKVRAAFGWVADPRVADPRVADPRVADPGPAAFERQALPTCVLVSLPHPSGRCRVWNEPGAHERAVGLLAQVAPWVPWGETRQEATIRTFDGTTFGQVKTVAYQPGCAESIRTVEGRKQ